jgi:hypothetical protein
MSLEEYISKIPKTAPADVLDLEFLVSQSLNFEFTIWHAHRAFWGLWLDLQVKALPLRESSFINCYPSRFHKLTRVGHRRVSMTLAWHMCERRGLQMLSSSIRRLKSL